jgi:hypothetical protein
MGEQPAEKVDLPHPGQQLALVLAGELREIAVHLQQGLLHDVAGVAFGAQVAAQLGLCQEPKIGAIATEKLLTGGSVAIPAAFNQFGCGNLRAHRLSSPSRPRGWFGDSPASS